MSSGSGVSGNSWERIRVDEADVRFPSMQQGFNRRFVGTNMEDLYLVYNSEGAREALDDAIQRHGAGTVKIVSGGHCYENFVFNSEVKAVINVSHLLESGRDSRGYYLSSGDTNWGAFKKLFSKYGKVLPSGSCYSVGLGGHISGGGEGISSRQHGLTVDWLTGVEVVVKPYANRPAELKYVSRESDNKDDRELFWAHTGGGGGNFGIITKYYFQDLPPAPEGFIVSNIHFSWNGFTKERLARLLDWYFDLAKNGPLNTVGKFQIFHKEAEEFAMSLYTSYQNKVERKDAMRSHYRMEQELNGLCPICSPTKALGGHGGWGAFPVRPRKVHRSAAQFITDYTFDYPTYALTETINGSGPNQRGKYKSAYMKTNFPPEQISAIFKNLTDIPNGLTGSDMKDSLLQVDIFGGKINEVAPEYTAIAQRSYVVKLQYQTYWQFEDADEKNIQWIRNFYNDMYGPYGGVPDPDTTVPSGRGVFEGCYYNYPDVDLNNGIRGKYSALELYFLGNLDRLIRVKKRWDRNNYFTHAQSIPPLTYTESLLDQ